MDYVRKDYFVFSSFFITTELIGVFLLEMVYRQKRLTDLLCFHTHVISDLISV